MITYRTLAENDIPALLPAMSAAFENYFVKIQVDMDTLLMKIAREGISLPHSVAAFDGARIIGFTLTAIGEWKGERAAYDASTGVLGEYRGRGIAGGTILRILPLLKAAGIRRYLLEVIRENEAAFKVYQKLGFRVSREFSVYRAEGPLILRGAEAEAGIEEIIGPDWQELCSIGNVVPSWQNSIDSIKRLAEYEGGMLKTIGVMNQGGIEGYAVFLPGYGALLQIAVREESRRKAIGTALLSAAQRASQKPLSLTNIPNDASAEISFLKKMGFVFSIGQYEMEMAL